MARTLRNSVTTESRQNRASRISRRTALNEATYSPDMTLTSTTYLYVAGVGMVAISDEEF